MRRKGVRKVYLLLLLLIVFLIPIQGVLCQEKPVLKVTTEYIKDLSTGKTLNVTKPTLKAGVPVEIFVELKPAVPDVSLISKWLYILSTTNLEDPKWVITFFFKGGLFKEKRISGKEAKTWDASLHDALKIQIKVTGRVPEPLVTSLEPYVGIETTGVSRREMTILNVSMYKGEPGVLFGGKYQYTVHAVFAVITSDSIETAISLIKESEGKIPPDVDLTPVFDKIYEIASKGHPGWAAEVAKAISEIPLFNRTKEYCNSSVCSPMVSELKKEIRSLNEEVVRLKDESRNLSDTISSLQRQLSSARSSFIPTVATAGLIALLMGVGVGRYFGKRSCFEELQRLKEKVEKASELSKKLKGDMEEIQLTISKFLEAPSRVKDVIKPTVEELYKINDRARRALDDLASTLESPS